MRLYIKEYGNYGGPDYSGGECVWNDAEKKWKWFDNPTKPPIDGMDDLFRDHDEVYGLAEKNYEKGIIDKQEHDRLKRYADKALYQALDSYDPYEDTRCLDKLKAFEYRADAMNAFALKIAWEDPRNSQRNAEWWEEQADRGFTTAQRSTPPRRDPLTLDLDGDGIETVPAAATNPIMFDHDGDGVKTGTGWVKQDDGFLVLDRNGNGTIDNCTAWMVKIDYCYEQAV